MKAKLASRIACVRRIMLVAAGALAAVALMAAPAGASTATPVLRQALVTPNFVVHYTIEAGTPDAIGLATARMVGDNAERALATEEAAFGFDPPLSGPDAHIDIYVYDLHAANEDAVVGPRSPHADQSESYILLRASRAGDLAVIAHEMFHVLQNSVWVSSGRFLAEATAEWAQERAFPREGFSKGFEPAAPLDCIDTTTCPDGSYQSWPFFEFLAERHGPRIVREIYEQAKALRVNRDGRASIAAVAATVVEHGAALAPTFRDFALANINGDYTLNELKDSGIGGLTDTRALRTGAKTGTRRSRSRVDHLATAYVPVTGGGGKKKGKCRKANLRLDISGPHANAFAGYVLGERKPKPIALAHGHGRVTLRGWSTCSGSELTLALINAGASGDARRFTVTARLTVH